MYCCYTTTITKDQIHLEASNRCGLEHDARCLDNESHDNLCCSSTTNSSILEHHTHTHTHTHMHMHTHTHTRTCTHTLAHVHAHAPAHAHAHAHADAHTHIHTHTSRMCTYCNIYSQQDILTADTDHSTVTHTNNRGGVWRSHAE